MVQRNPDQDLHTKNAWDFINRYLTLHPELTILIYHQNNRISVNFLETDENNVLKKIAIGLDKSLYQATLQANNSFMQIPRTTAKQPHARLIPISGDIQFAELEELILKRKCRLRFTAKKEAHRQIVKNVFIETAQKHKGIIRRSVQKASGEEKLIEVLHKALDEKPLLISSK